MNAIDYPLAVMHHYELGIESSAAFLRQVGRGDMDKIKGIERVSKSRRALLPYGAIVLQEIIAAMQPSKIVVSALGVREGFLYSLLSPEEQRADPLISASEELALLRARSVTHARELADWTGETFAAFGIEETEDEVRYRRAACLLADIGWRAHPEYRGTQSLNIIAHASFIGVDHPGRAFIALANLFRHEGVFDDSVAPEIRALAPPRYLERARVLGATLRVVYLLLGLDAGRHSQAELGAPRPMACWRWSSRLRIAGLDGERPAGRLAQLARITGRTSLSWPMRSARDVKLAKEGNDAASSADARKALTAVLERSAVPSASRTRDHPPLLELERDFAAHQLAAPARRTPRAASRAAPARRLSSPSAASRSMSSLEASTLAATPSFSATSLQQHLQQLGGSARAFLAPAACAAASACSPWAWPSAALTTPSSAVGRRRALPALGRGAQPRQRRRVARLLLGDLVDRVVLEHAAARHVALARLALAPGRDRLHDRQLLRLAQPHLQPLPGVLRMRIVGLARGQHLHLLVQPVGAVLALQLGLEVLVDVDQMGDVGQRIVELLFRQRPVAPVGEARRLVELRAGDLLDELVVGDAVAEAADHGRDLGVEHRMRDQAAEMEDDLDVLPRGMEDLGHRLVGHQLEERLQGRCRAPADRSAR